MTASVLLDRRTWLGGTLGLLAGCRDAIDVPVRWAGASPERGHRVRQPAVWPVGDAPTRVDVLVVGGGVAGLSAARALQSRGVDVRLLELEDEPGGNSRGVQLQGHAAPLGAHYLPVPGDAAREVRGLLETLGLARYKFGRWVYDERYLCHSPQERLFFDGAWHEGLLPPAEPGSATARQYRAFAQAVADAQRKLGFDMPTVLAPWTAGHAALDAMTFSAWLRQHGFDDARLRWYLEYCCRDDYGAGVDVVSAWAGLHYFASRHGFHAGAGDADAEPVLTWPEGNGWLTRAMAAPLRGQVASGQVVQRVRVGRDAVDVLSWDVQRDAPRRWRAGAVVMAVPLGVAARVLESPPPALRDVAPIYAPWLVANVLVSRAPLPRLGAPASWDNVVYGARSLGYVDAGHQRLDAQAGGARVLSLYWALPPGERAALLTAPAQRWRDAALGELATVHPDLPALTTEVVLARHGHAMAVPVPRARGSAALAALRQGAARLAFAHADLSSYSVFEEAYTVGIAAARRVTGT